MKETERPTDNNKKKTLDEMTRLEIIEHCGKLKYYIHQILNILYNKDKTIDTDEIARLLSTPGTDEYKAYHAGMAAGDFEIDTAAHEAAASGDPDAQKLLREIQGENVIGDAIQERFFPDTDE